ncbi:MAG: ACP S-malonyltransferase [Phycisphaerales bacterium JB043]
MSTNRILLCPGQGAQQVGMGRAWFESSPVAAQTFAAADEILSDTLDRPLSDICFNGPNDQLNRTDIAQPALFVCAVASHQALVTAGWAEPPVATAGLSLGEYTALHLAGALSFTDALKLVALRGSAMQDAAESSEGSMVAVIGATLEQAEQLCDSARQQDVLQPANLNAPGQIVISGSASACARAIDAAADLSLRATSLAVAGAFHSPLMQPAADRLESALANTEFKAPTCPVLSNVTGQPHAPDGDRSLEDTIRARLVEQLTMPVRWIENCQWLANNATGEYHELAPGKVLKGLMRRIDKSISVEAHDEP